MGTRRIEGVAGEVVVKRAFWLAWQACGGTLGLGFLKNRPEASEDDVWAGVCEARDYGGISCKRIHDGGVYGDYVFGRMMKLSVKFTKDTITTRDDTPRADYQAWCLKYPSYDALINAAAEEIGAKLV